MDFQKQLNRKSLYLVSGLLFNLLSISAQIPEGYYDNATGLASGELKTALHQIIRGGKRLNYGKGAGATWSGFEKTDLHPDGYVWDMYSYNKRYFTGNASAPGGMNIEHSVAKSWWGGTENNAYKDLYHLNPSDANANSARSNYPLGVVKNGTTNGSLKIGDNSFGTEYSGICFEPLDEYKGDFARAYMYMFTCYEDLKWTGTKAPTMLDEERYPMLKPWAADLLLTWHRMDPVSEKELNRAAEIFKIQENRNPFIDHPEIAEYLWGEQVGEAFFFTPNTNPVFLSPANNSCFEFPEIHYEETASLEILLKACNLISGITLSLQGQDSGLFELAQTAYTAEEVEAGVKIKLSFHPVKAMPAEAELILKGEGLTDRKVRILAKATENFDVLPAQNITHNSFEAVWTSSSLTNRFFIDVYNKQENFKENVLIEDASFATSLSGGWSSTGSIYYDDGEKKGVRLATGSKDGAIFSPKLDLTTGGTVTFSAKKWSSDTNVKVTVKQNSTIIGEMLLTDQYANYTLPLVAANAESVISFHANADKRLFVATVQIYSGGTTIEEKSLKGFPQWVENTNRLQIQNLCPDSTYYYCVTPDFEGATTSKEISVRTKIATSIDETTLGKAKIFVSGNQIRIETVEEGMHLVVINTAGKKIKEMKLNGRIGQVELESKGIYFINIATKNTSICHKIVIR